MNLSNTIVIKVGTNVVTRENPIQGGPSLLDLNVMDDIVQQICKVVADTRKRVILVSSGAVAAGKSRITLSTDIDSIVAKQTYAFVGQQSLTATYDALFSKAQPLLVPGQGLVTSNNFTNPVERARMLAVLNALPMNVVPIFNENDTVATEELTFGDNDQLAANIAQLVQAQMLILLTDVDGVFDKDPSKNADAQLIQRIVADKITDDFIRSCGLSKSKNGTGGMESKLKAAINVVENGIRAFIANGKRGRNLLRIVNGEDVGTQIVREV